MDEWRYHTHITLTNSFTFVALNSTICSAIDLILIFALNKKKLYQYVCIQTLVCVLRSSASKINVYEVQKENLIITMAVLWACSINNGVWFSRV